MKTRELTELNPKKDYLEALQKRIRFRAYQLYEQRGRETGRDLDDWLLAESEEMKAGPRKAAA